MAAIAAGVYASSVSRDTTDVVEDTYVLDEVEAEGVYTPDVAEVVYTPTETEEVADIEADLADIEENLSIRESMSILLLGIDTFEFEEQGLPDSIILVTINPEEATTKMVSIPRDTRTEIVGMYFDDKINHAYNFGGTEMTINTVQNLLDIPIDHYAKVNMTGLQALVDVVGGVEVENDLDFTFDGAHFPLGTVHLNGAEALGFTRMRQEDPRGDFGRQLRQRLVMEAIFNELSSLSDITQFAGILDAIREHVDTDIELNDAMNMFLGGFRNAFANIEQPQLLVGEGQIVDGIYYQVLSYEETANARAILRTHLGLVGEEETID